MTDESIYINSLRLSRLGGGSNSKIVPPYPFIQWFYNGSTRFEEDVNNPRVFNDLSGAVAYFTEKTAENDRTIGQFITFAEGTRRNWVVYIYMGPNVSDENYSNYIFWHPFGATYIDPYTNIEEVLSADKAFQEALFANTVIQETLKVENYHD